MSVISKRSQVVKMELCTSCCKAQIPFRMRPKQTRSVENSHRYNTKIYEWKTRFQDIPVKSLEPLNRTTAVCVDEMNVINVLVRVPRPIQHSLQPSVCLVTSLIGYDGRRKKEREIVPCFSPSWHNVRFPEIDRFNTKMTSLTFTT